MISKVKKNSSGKKRWIGNGTGKRKKERQMEKFLKEK